MSGIDAYVLALRLANARALEAEAEVARLRAQVAAVEALHYRSRWESSVPPGSVCACGQSPYPCATVRALAARGAIVVAGLANAVIRDTYLTNAEQAARMNAYAECLDAETEDR